MLLETKEVLPGQFEIPTVSEFSGLVFPEGGLPVRMRFLLEDGTRLLIPIEEDAVRELGRILDSMGQSLSDAGTDEDTTGLA